MQVLGFLLGHLVGDYLFQTEFMAKNKARNDLLGWMACLLHSVIYSLAVVSFLYIFNQHEKANWALLYGLIFLTHFPIDKWSLGKYWMKVIKGASNVLQAPTPINFETLSPVSIYWFVYIVTDNTMHLLLMTLVLVQLFPGLLS